jgi:hypothetical protein
MPKAFLYRPPSIHLAFIITGILIFFTVPTSHAATLEELRADLPIQFMGWISRAPDQIYNPKTINRTGVGKGYINLGDGALVA